MPNQLPLIELHDLTKFYFGRHSVVALRKVTLSIYPGELVLILGPSGCGKSTLLTLMGGLHQPNQGRIVIDRQALDQLSENELTNLRRDKVGFVFQYFNLLNSLTAWENVALPLRLRELPEEQVRQRALQMLDQVGLAHRAHHLPAQLSGGEQQRVAVARAVVVKPDLLLADEPTGNLDRTNSDMIMQLLKRINREGGQTCVIVSHDASFRRIADRVVHMRDGMVESIEAIQGTQL